MNRSERMQRLRDRQKEQAKNRDSGGNNFGILDLTKVEGDVNFYKLKAKKNIIDIIPYEITSNKHPQNFKKDEIDYKLDIWIHRNVGVADSQVICLQNTFGRPCPICEEKKQLMDNGLSWDDEGVKALTPKRRCLYNVIDLDDEDKGIQILDISYHWFEKEVYDEAESSNPEFTCFADLEEGYTIEFRGAEESFMGKQIIKPKSFGFKERDAYSEDILDEVFPLEAMLKIPTYDEVMSMFHGMSTEEEPDNVLGEDDPPICKCGYLIGKDFKINDDCKECDDDTFEFCGELFDEISKDNKEEETARRKARKEETETSKRVRRRRG